MELEFYMIDMDLLIMLKKFTGVLKIDPIFSKANEINFRLGLLYKQQQKYEQSLEVNIFLYFNFNI